MTTKQNLEKKNVEYEYSICDYLLRNLKTTIGSVINVLFKMKNTK